MIQQQNPQSSKTKYTLIGIGAGVVPALAWWLVIAIALGFSDPDDNTELAIYFTVAAIPFLLLVILPVVLGLRWARQAAIIENQQLRKSRLKKLLLKLWLIFLFPWLLLFALNVYGIVKSICVSGWNDTEVHCPDWLEKEPTLSDRALERLREDNPWLDELEESNRRKELQRSQPAQIN